MLHNEGCYFTFNLSLEDSVASLLDPAALCSAVWRIITSWSLWLGHLTLSPYHSNSFVCNSSDWWLTVLKEFFTALTRITLGCLWISLVWLCDWAQSQGLIITEYSLLSRKNERKGIHTTNYSQIALRFWTPLLLSTWVYVVGFTPMRSGGVEVANLAAVKVWLKVG